ncbi:hypothetical protein DDZ13_08755 [Coraliomargarita sinensis]|uniref:Uncharacterized protein n=1 Tax=Coraliomargarita sinensis TaxID=2174842 RepID=A0A317ZJN2_9BACT|nr:hypothetical protein [Coraliomargarita sinensis]PXA04118.1 hypothetical protein DDZ13_08755 [Coraliomargarita sinensis]
MKPLRLLAVVVCFTTLVCYSFAQLETKQFDVNYYHLISLDPVSSSKKKLNHSEGEGNPEHWKELSKDDLSMIDWLENLGVPFCRVDGASLVYHKQRELYEAIKAGEENLGVIEVTNTPTNLGILEYRLISKTNAYLRGNNRASEQIRIEGFPMPHEIGPPSFIGLDDSEVIQLINDWEQILPELSLHSVQKKANQSGRALYVLYGPKWDRDRGFWKLNEGWLRFSKERWSNLYESNVVREEILSMESSEVHISYLSGLRPNGVVVGDGLNEEEFSSLVNALGKVGRINFQKDYVVTGQRARSSLERVKVLENGYLLFFEGGFQVTCSIHDDVLRINQVMYFGY